MDKADITTSLLALPAEELTDYLAQIDCARKAISKIETHGEQSWVKLRASVSTRTRASFNLPGGVKWLRATLEEAGYLFYAAGKQLQAGEKTNQPMTVRSGSHE